MRWMLGLGAAVLCGCATPMQPGQAQAIAQASQEWELCYVAITGRGSPVLRQAVHDDMRRRGTDCNHHMPMVQARIQQDSINAANANARTQLGLDMMRAARPQAQPMPAPTTCRSMNMGTYVRTVCD